MDRKQLETKIEKEAYEFMTMIKEAAADSVMLYAQRNNIGIEYSTINALLDQYKVALDAEWMSKADFFLGKLDKDLEVFTEQTNPMRLTKSTKKKQEDQLED